MNKRCLLLLLTFLSLFTSNAFAYRDLDTGEFITKDPTGFVDGPNIYTYVGQNPWTSFDSEGLWATKYNPSPSRGAANFLGFDWRPAGAWIQSHPYTTRAAGIAVATPIIIASLPEDAAAGTVTLGFRTLHALSTSPALHAVAAALFTGGVVYHDTGSVKDAVATSVLIGGQSYAEGAFSNKSDATEEVSRSLTDK